MHGTKARHTKLLKKKLTNMKEKLLMTLKNKKDIRNYGTLSTH